MRKTGRWYRLSQLKYVSELGEEGIVHAVDELCGTLGSDLNAKPANSSRSTGPTPPSAHSQERKEVINLISDDEDHYSEDMSQPGPSFSQQRYEAVAEYSDCSGTTFSHYAQDETKAKLPELLKCLTADELKVIGRTLKLPNGLTTVSVRSFYKFGIG